jgi:hypothetical protein
MARVRQADKVAQETDGSGADDGGVDEAAGVATKPVVSAKPAPPATPVPQGQVKLMDGERELTTGLLAKDASFA